MTSYGSIYRTLINAFPALLFLALKKRFHLQKDYILLITLSYVSLMFVPLSYMVSTAADRLLPYLAMVQICLWPKILADIFQNTLRRQFFLAIVLCGYALTLFVWLTFGNHSHQWIPYKISLYG